MPQKPTRKVDAFDMLMDEIATPDRYSTSERLMLAAHLIRDAHCEGKTPAEFERLIARARDIVRTVDKELAREIVNSATRP